MNEAELVEEYTCIQVSGGSSLVQVAEVDWPLPLSPHPLRQEIDPRLEILIEIAIPSMDFSQRAKGLRRGRE